MVCPERAFSEIPGSHNKQIAYLFSFKNHKQDGPTFEKDRA